METWAKRNLVFISFDEMRTGTYKTNAAVFVLLFLLYFYSFFFNQSSIEFVQRSFSVETRQKRNDYNFGNESCELQMNSIRFFFLSLSIRFSSTDSLSLSDRCESSCKYFNSQLKYDEIGGSFLLQIRSPQLRCIPKKETYQRQRNLSPFGMCSYIQWRLYGDYIKRDASLGAHDFILLCFVLLLLWTTL